MSATQALRLLPSEYNQTPPVNWRWERARWLREHGKYVRKGAEDDWVVIAVRFQRELAKAQDSYSALRRLERKYPAVYWAWFWYQEVEQSVRWTMEAYMCAEEKLARIAERVGKHRHIVAAYSKLFFDVFGKTHHRMFMMNEVIGGAIHRGVSERQYDLLWKLFGLLKGPVFLDFYTSQDSEQGHLSSLDQCQVAKHGLIADAAGVQTLKAIKTMPVAFNQEIILNFYTKLREIEKKSDDPAAAQGLMVNNVNAAMVNIGFSFGRQERPVDQESLALYDEACAELRASEMVKLALGGEPEGKQLLTNLKFPEAKDGQPHQQGS